MRKIITIDENTRIVIESFNYMLQYRRQSKTKISWRRGGYFPDLISLSTEYVNSAPLRAENSIKTFERLIEVVIRSTDQISQVIIDNQLNLQ